MSSNYQEQIALQRTMVSRHESPALEGAAAMAIEEAFRELIEQHYLYQKITVDLAPADKAVRQAVDYVIKQAASQPLSGSGKSSFVSPVTQERLKELHVEIEKRPWRLATRHMGDDPSTAEIRRYARSGTQPLGTDVNDLNLHFYLPAVQLQCPGLCKKITTFAALASSNDSGFGGPYPRKRPAGTEQIFVPIYRCELCRETIYTILVRRIGLRVHLCGFAPRREPFALKPVPESLRPILADAEEAVAEGDTYGAFYHLRTMLEHYLKERLNIPIAQQIPGDDLVSEYYKSLPEGIKSALPSLTTAWEKLSVWLHTRTGEPDDYKTQRDAVCKHIEVIVAMGDGAFVKPANGGAGKGK